MIAKMKFVFNGPASRREADDKDEWEEIRSDREAIVSKIMGTFSDLKVKVSRDILIVTLKTRYEITQELLNPIIEKILEIGSDEFAPDAVEVSID